MQTLTLANGNKVNFVKADEALDYMKDHQEKADKAALDKYINCLESAEYMLEKHGKDSKHYKKFIELSEQIKADNPHLFNKPSA